jgi:hypothetical protein
MAARIRAGSIVDVAARALNILIYN